MSIAELKEANEALVEALAKCRAVFEYGDDMVESGAIGDPLAVPNFVQGQVSSLHARAAHWKANHGNMVKLNAFLRDRPDLPADRLGAYERAKKEAARECAEIARLTNCSVYSKFTQHGEDVAGRIEAAFSI